MHDGCGCKAAGCEGTSPRWVKTRIESVIFDADDGCLIRVEDCGNGSPCFVGIVNPAKGFESCVGCKIKICTKTSTIFVKGRPWAEKVGKARFRLIDPPAQMQAEGEDSSTGRNALDA